MNVTISYMQANVFKNVNQKLCYIHFSTYELFGQAQ